MSNSNNTFQNLYYIILTLALIVTPIIYTDWYYSLVSLIVGVLAIGLITGLIIQYPYY